VELAAVVDHRLPPQQAQQVHLLVQPPAAALERDAQAFVLHVVPAGADGQHEPAAGQHVHLGGLLGHQGGLPLGQDEHGGPELDGRGAGGEEAEQHERLVERIVLGVRAGQRRIAVGVHGAEHMIVDQQPAVAESLGGLGEIADDRRIRADLRRREHHPEVHLFLLFTRARRRGCASSALTA